jgi:protein TonB
MNNIVLPQLANLDAMLDAPMDAAGRDRLGFALCLAGALHAVLILGVTFSKENRAAVAQRLEITLAQFNSENAPKTADFLAQANQEGSGTLSEKKELTTQQLAAVNDNQIRDAAKNLQQASAPEQSTADRRLASSAKNRDVSSRDARQPIKQPLRGAAQLAQLNQEIASLEAKLDIQRQAYAKRPRVRRLTSMSTKQADDAMYLHKWRSKVEAIGNLNYPDEAKRKNIHGELRLLVALLPNGEINEVKILKSSGKRILDDAAIRIVHLAAPYPAFSREMSKQVDVLEIIRTWRFEKSRLLSEN